MAIIRKTVSGLKPDSNYLFAVKPKNTEISASDTIPDSIRIKTPSSGSVPSTITSFNIYCNFESVMFVFQPVVDQDFAEYEYEIYDGDSLSSNLVSTGKKRSTVFVISVANTTSNVNPTTGVETVVYKKYYGRVRAINTSGNAGIWTSLATHSGNTPLIEDQYIGSLTAGKITTGLMTAEQVILQNASGTLRSYTPTAGMSVIRSSNFKTGPLGTGEGWIIRGDGTAEFDAASIRGTLSANSIFIDANNRWAINSTNSAGSSQFVVGDNDNQLSFDPAGGTPVGGVPKSLFKVGNNTNFIKVDNGNLAVTGAITTNATISSSTAGGLIIGTDSIQFGSGGYGSSIFFAGRNAGVDKFSIGSKLLYDSSVGGGTLTIDGTVIIGVGGTAASTVASNAATGASALQSGNGVTKNGSNQITQISGSGVTITSNGNTTLNRVQLDSNGLKAYNNVGTETVAINSDGSAIFTGAVTGSTITGGTINSNNNLFRVDASGNVFANNIYATGFTTPTGSSSQLGLQIRADGNGGSTSGAIWIVSAKEKETKIGNVDGSLNIRWREADGTIPAAVVLEPAWFDVNTWRQTRHFEINMASGYAFYINSDIVLRGSGLDGVGTPSNNFFSDSPVESGSSAGWPARWISSTTKGDYAIARGTSTQANKENIYPVSGFQALEILKKLQLKQFTYKKNTFDDDTSYIMKQLDIDYGFMAEDVAEEIPSLAIYDFTKSGKQKLKSENFSYEDLNNSEYVKPAQWKNNAVLSLLVGAVQGLNERVEFLEAQLAAK